MGRQRAWLVAAVAGAVLAGGCTADVSPRPAAGAPAPSTSAAAPPKPTTAARVHVDQLRMVSRTDGWAYLDVDNSGIPVLASTTDGARTWHPAGPSGRCGTGPALPAGPSLTDAWTASSTPPGKGERTEVTVCQTHDGGRHWTTVGGFGTTGSPSSVQFVGPRRGWVLTTAANGMHSPSDVHLFRTTNGGRHWRQVAASVTGILGGHSFGGLPSTCAGGIRFADASTGWYAGGCPQGGGVVTGNGWADDVAVTRDGGRHWHPVRLPHPRVRSGRAGCRVNAACWFSVVAPRLPELFAGGGATSEPNVLYRGLDGGTTWAVDRLPLESTQVATFDGTHLLQVSGESRRAYASADAGRTWHRLADLPHPAVLGPCFVSRRTAFVALAHSRGLYRTDDGGRTWTHVPARLSPWPTPQSAPQPAPSPVPSPAPSPARPLTLLPPPCGHDDVTLAQGDFLSPATGEHGQIFDVRLRGATPCTLWGTPRVRLLDAHGAVMRFGYAHRGQYLPDAPAAPVVVRPVHPAHIVVAKYRCDVTRDAPVAVAARVHLPFVRGGYTLRIPFSGAAGIPRCGKGDGAQVLEVSRIVGALGKPAPPRPPYAVSMRSPLPSPYGASYGRGDLNGDGRADLVLLRRSGLLTARVSGLGIRRLRLPRDVTLRLQALSTLGHGPRDYILAAATAHGCCGVYPYSSSGAMVIGLRHGRLGLVRIGGKPWYLHLDDGVGDLYQGLTCTPDEVTEVSAYLLAPHRLRVVRRGFALQDLRVRRVSRQELSIRGGPSQAMRLSRSHCPGMNARGWASVGGTARGRP